MITVLPADRGPVDMHVHLVGNGVSGSDCWLRPGFLHRFMANWMLRQIGLPVSWRAAEFDAAYVDLVARLVRESGVSHAVLLGHEEVYDASGRKLKFGSFHIPNTYLFTVCRGHPQLLPAVSIHPARADAMDELERCLEAGAVMMKCLPNCHNIDTRLPQYRAFWERMASAKLPLLAHTGGEHTVPQFDKKLADPATLAGALDCGVTVIAAHCATKSGLTDPDYLSALVEMMARYPNLYADLSALNLPLRSAGLKSMLARPDLHSRLLHGSDFPVPVQPVWAKWRKIITPADAIRSRGIKNLIERDYQLKKAMGFPDKVFTQVWDLLRVG
ncbi:MAG TPA: amidohydrolase family protein [Verrucomicrobiales bacterium]|nr:amidohydrolase family protein [Verrucomicrobiales bacterium]